MINKFKKNREPLFYFLLYTIVCRYANMSELLNAVEAGNVREVKRLIKSGAHVNETSFVKNVWYATALHIAALSGSLEMVKYLVEHGAEINYKKTFDQTALHMAAKSGSLKIFKYLVEHGADIKCKNSLDENALYVAASSGSLEIVKYLVEHGADINCKNSYYQTALHNAVRSGSMEIVKYLVEHSADNNSGFLDDENALYLAASSGSLEIVKYLVEHGAKVTRENCRGRDTILWWACFKGNHVIVDYLLQRGAIEDLNTQVEDSPLSVACRWGHTAVVQTLLKYNVDIRKVRVLECGNDEIINILNHELKKSIKHREKIEILKTMDEENIIKVICLTNELLPTFRMSQTLSILQYVLIKLAIASLVTIRKPVIYSPSQWREARFRA